MSRLFISIKYGQEIFIHFILNVAVSIYGIPFVICSLERAARDALPYFLHEVIHKIQVMIGVVYERRYLSCPVEVPQIGFRETPADIAAAQRVERPGIRFAGG